MSEYEDIIRREIDRYLSRRPNTRIGIVTSYDPNRHAVKVTQQPEGSESGWIPISTAHVGNGFGVAIGLTPGDQVMVGYAEGDLESPFVIGRLHSDKERPPVAQSGEIVVQSKSGFILKVAQDGTVSITTGGNALAIDAGAGDIALTSAKLTHNGHDIGSDHLHTEVVKGGDLSGPPQ